ncbi:MAG: hypothetical protein LBS55_03980 [Prevotellaceae bacterium]|jgi:hypothetical protein|nr:hypothetical protein [Prevotellaceae bacterium]
MKRKLRINNMRLQLLYIVDKEPLEQIKNTAEDLFRQKDADVCIVSNSTNDKVLRFFSANMDKIRAYKCYNSAPENYIHLFGQSLVEHGTFAGYVFVVPGTSLPANFSQTCLNTFAKHSDVTRIILASDKYDKDLFFRDMILSKNISCANVCMKTGIIPQLFSNNSSMYAKPWCDTVYNLLQNHKIVSNSIPLFELPKGQNSFFYFLGQYLFLIDIHKMPYYENVSWAKLLKRNALDALHSHGRYAADFAETLRNNDPLTYNKINILSRIMLRQN